MTAPIPRTQALRALLNRDTDWAKPPDPLIAGVEGRAAFMSSSAIRTSADRGA